MLALLVIPVAACDSASDGAVVTSPVATGIAESANSSAGAPIVAATGSGRGAARGKGNRNIDPNPQTDVINAVDTAALVWMREEEKLARDVYLALNEQWGMPIFENIASSEQRHMDAVLGLLNNFGIEDPVANNGVGVFTNPELQDLYDELVKQGSAARSEALVVGASIEDLDIRDLREAMAATANAGIERVLRNLEKASLKHLGAFASQLTRSGIAYTPEYMDMGEYETIAATTQRGEHGQKGRGRRSTG